MGLRLYDYTLSGSCYKVRLLMNFLGLEYERVPVDFYPGREHKTPAFLEINALGQLPVLEDGALRLRDSQAILCHLKQFPPDLNLRDSQTVSDHGDSVH